MMGRLKSDQGQLVYEFHLSDAVPEDHLVRKFDTALDLSWLRSELAPQYSSMGRPSIEIAIPENISRARNELFHEGDVFRHVLERVVEACLAAVWILTRGEFDLSSSNSGVAREREC